MSIAAGLHRGAAITISATMGSLTIVEQQPFIQVSLQLLQGGIQGLAKSDLIEFFLDGAMEAFTNAIGLRGTGLGLGVLNVFQSQV